LTDKERLENMSPIGFDLNGNVLLKGDDYHWLMEQAERVEELEEEKDEWKYTAQSYYMTNQKLREQNKRYREAIEKSLVESGWGDEGNALYRTIGILTKALEGEE